MGNAEVEVPWGELEGGYRQRYDPRPAFAALADGHGDWDELWQELHHQGDVGVASYSVSLPRRPRVYPRLETKA